MSLVLLFSSQNCKFCKIRRNKFTSIKFYTHLTLRKKYRTGVNPQKWETFFHHWRTSPVLVKFWGLKHKKCRPANVLVKYICKINIQGFNNRIFKLILSDYFQLISIIFL